MIGMNLTRRRFATLLAAFGLATPYRTVAATEAKSGKSLTVIELFTSEGCWSCPPAEKKLAEIADDPDILALAYHVDYWDYIGWPDPFANPEYTRRQRRYAGYFQSRTVYTPQMVFQGSSHAPGSRPGEVENELRRVARLERIDIGLRHASDVAVEIILPEVANAPHSQVLLVVYDHTQTSEVLRGENAGKTLTHRNVVREMISVTDWQGRAETLTVELPHKRTSDRMGCAVLVQSTGTGRILGGSALDL